MHGMMQCLCVSIVDKLSACRLRNAVLALSGITVLPGETKCSVSKTACPDAGRAHHSTRRSATGPIVLKQLRHFRKNEFVASPKLMHQHKPECAVQCCQLPGQPGIGHGCVT